MLKVIETKGEVKFIEDEKGKLYQQIGEGDLLKVKNGAMTYKRIKTVNKYIIKYNLNGVHGFSVWRSSTNLEDGIWSFSEAERIANEM